MPENLADGTQVRVSFVKNRPSFCWAQVIACTFCLAAAPVVGGPVSGPSRVRSQNLRYFADGSGKAIYLTGSDHWSNLHNSRRLGEPVTRGFDYDGYLELLAKLNHNSLRMWAWEGRAR